MRSAWAAFSKYTCVFKSCVSAFALTARQFEMVVTPVALYSFACWTLTVNMEHQLCRTRRKMLKIMRCSHRWKDEERIDYIKRTTAEAERCMHILSFVCCVQAAKMEFCCQNGASHGQPLVQE